MKSRTYYEILGVSRDASIEEITIAKNALAKVYHPDANAHKDIDTTAFMQEILEAYQTLSDPEKRKGYDAQFFGNSEPVERVFKTFKLEPEEKTAESVSFVTYWNAYSSLNEILEKSLQLMNREEKKKKCRSDCSESLDGLNMKIHTAIVRSQKWPGRQSNISLY